MGKDNTKSGLLDYPQSNIQIQLSSDKEWRGEGKSRKNMDVEQSVVLETFRQAPSMYE
jgi:hypothetical protein